nr:MiaB/RimO family radical SAM methylthiotransferase [Acidisphaera sp. L21]
MQDSVLTFGCRLNLVESEAIRGMLNASEGTVVINTCAVTAEAERQGRQAIRRVVREQPGAQIVVTGCAVQLDPARWQALPGVSRVLGNADKLRPENWAHAASRVSPIDATAPLPSLNGFASHTRGFVQVQAGCDHRCTFCTIPFGRGPNRSVPAMEAVAQVAALVAAGVQEVVLTGVDIASHADGIGRLAATILRDVPDLARLRLSSLDPATIDAPLWDLLADEPRLMPHLHLSLQSGSDLVLKRMRRRHTSDAALETIARARQLRPGLAIGADLIAGFPTESDVLAEDTEQFLEQAAIPYVHVFPYSERPGTPAARMPAVPVPVRRERAARLRSIAAGHAAAFHRAQLGATVSVLAERGGRGHTQHFTPVRLNAEPGALLQARVIAADAYGLQAEAA